ncbi:hypothetical protein [Thaumasiovibrio sp. DFM-14]|uniref:hypothetical protein n=1 Tax=Thaumasiovibrio sp. DFM-14 TaxID=3384792 RepID=UPI0039A08840
MSTESECRYLVYVIYGHDETYYQGARFGILSFLSHWEGGNPPQVVVLTECPEKFEGMPIDIIGLSNQQIREWSLDGAYRFRIKNRALHFFITSRSLSEQSKILFMDTDFYFSQATNIFYEHITDQQALMFFPETSISNLPDDNEYAVLRQRDFVIQGKQYRVTEQSMMWASAVIGITPRMIEALEYADQLILAFRKAGCMAHTLEQFALSEALSRNVNLREAKPWVQHYSTSGRKDYARKVLQRFFSRYGSSPFEVQVTASRGVNFRRTLVAVVQGHIYKKKKKLRKLLGLPEE